MRKITILGETHVMKRGDVVVIPPHVMRDVEAFPADREPFHYITVCCDILVGSIEMSELYRFPTVGSLIDSSGFENLVAESFRLLHETDDLLHKLRLRPNSIAVKEVKTNEVNVDDTIALLTLNSLFHHWFVLFLRLMRPYLPERPIFVDPRIQQVCSFIQNNIGNPIKISDIARHTYVSESHLRLLFRKTFGISPMDYLQQARMRRSKELLSNTKYSIKEISEMTGFQSQSLFSRSFAKSEGISAREYRTLAMRQNDKH
jgi:AraC-like DNA-binding protein